MNRDIKEHAKGLTEPALELIGSILLKHDEAIIESVYERLKEKDEKISSMQAEIDEQTRRVKDAFFYAYEQGHHDTVESQYGYIEESFNDWLEELEQEKE